MAPATPKEAPASRPRSGLRELVFHDDEAGAGDGFPAQHGKEVGDGDGVAAQQDIHGEQGKDQQAQGCR